ncbi:unnamed protein product, partial [Polarella glacialis]
VLLERRRLGRCAGLGRAYAIKLRGRAQKLRCFYHWLLAIFLRLPRCPPASEELVFTPMGGRGAFLKDPPAFFVKPMAAKAEAEGQLQLLPTLKTPQHQGGAQARFQVFSTVQGLSDRSEWESSSLAPTQAEESQAAVRVVAAAAASLDLGFPPGEPLLQRGIPVVAVTASNACPTLLPHDRYALASQAAVSDGEYRRLLEHNRREIRETRENPGARNSERVVGWGASNWCSKDQSGAWPHGPDPAELGTRGLPDGGEFLIADLEHERTPALIALLVWHGFLPMAGMGSWLLPKIHQHRCVLNPRDVHIGKKVRRRAKGFHLTVDKAWSAVVSNIQQLTWTSTKGDCWLYDQLTDAYQAVASVGEKWRRGGAIAFHSVELWHSASGELVAGEIGYTCGSVYSSCTGFAMKEKHPGAGSVQLAALGRWLARLGFELWDLGMELDYKLELGGQMVPRSEWARRIRDLRSHVAGPLLSPGLPSDASAQALLGEELPPLFAAQNETETEKEVSGRGSDRPPESGVPVGGGGPDAPVAAVQQALAVPA